MNRFDSLQIRAQGVVTRTMGYTASWTPLAGGPTYTGDVLFNKPTQKEGVVDEDYIIQRPRIEYLEGSFPGLFESVNDHNNEYVYVTFSPGDSQRFITMIADKKYDGKTIIVYLEPKDQ